MFKKLILAVAVALTMGVAANAQKFAVVSADEIMATMPEMTEIRNKIAESSKMYESEYSKLQEEFQKKFAEYQELEKDATTPQGIKERRMQELQEIDQKAQQFMQTAQQDLERQQVQLLQPVQQKVVDAIKKVGANNNFVMVFPAELPLYVDVNAVTDITSLVKTELGIPANAKPLGAQQ